MKNLFFDTETTINIKLGSILEKLTQCHNRTDQADLNDCDNETCTSSQFLQIQKKQLIGLQEHLERYCDVLPIFVFNSAKYDLNLMKCYLLPVLVNERNIEPTVIRKANQFISFKFCDIQLLDYYEFSWRCNKFWFLLEGIQNFRDKRILPLRLVWSPQQHAESETSPVWCFLH